MSRFTGYVISFAVIGLFPTMALARWFIQHVQGLYPDTPSILLETAVVYAAATLVLLFYRSAFRDRVL
jgi:hypothetical protein